MKRHLALILALFTLSSLAQSTIPVTGQKVLDNNMIPLTGQLVFTVTDTTNTPVTYTPLGGSASTAPFVIPVVAGAVQNVNGFTATIANPATMSPANTRYRIQVQSVGGVTTYFTFPLTNITQIFFSYDGYAIPAGITVSGAGLPHIPCSPHAQYTNTLSSDPYPWVCSQLQGDSALAWTQNPSLNPSCQRGNDQAIASSLQGMTTFCVDANQAFVTPGFVWAGPLPGTNPSQIGLVPVNTLCAGGNCGAGGTPAAPSFAVQLANSGATAFASDANITINPTAHVLSTPTIAANNLLNALGMGAHADSAADYSLRLTNGNVANEAFPLARPWIQNQTVNRRWGPAQGTNPVSTTLFLLSGMDNTEVVQGTYAIESLNSFSLTPQQGGGDFQIQSQCYAVGDCVGSTMFDFGRGVSRQEDEGTENPRYFLAPINDTAGGTLAVVSTDSQGANPIQTGALSSQYSRNFYEKSFILDVTKKWPSPGNIASIGTATDDRFSYFQGDSTSGITAQVGVSSQTLLTAPVDNFVYTGACGSQIETSAQYPISGPSIGANDAFMTNYQGVGVAGENTNYAPDGSIVGFCATVASTAGMAAGDLIFIADSDYQVEFTRIIAVASTTVHDDTTHFTAFFRQPHSTGATVNWGGAVGSCIGADVDITPPGTNSTANNTQFSTQRLCYPIVQSLAGDMVTVYTNTEGSDINNLRTLLPSANTPKVPLTITAPVVTGGVLTGFTANDVIGNANNYQANNTGAANSGHPSALPIPTVTISGCTVAPTLKWSTVNANVGLTYAPTVATGGSGCGTVTFNIASSYPTPFGIYPLAEVYKSEDPAQPPGVVNPTKNVLTDGNPVLMPFNTAAWATGDEIMAPDWWNGQGVSGQTHMEGNYLHALDGRNGAMIGHFFSGVGNQFPAEEWLNEEATAHYFGSFANNYVKVLPSDYLVNPPSAFQFDGQFSTDFNFSYPPLNISNGIINGGSVIQVICNRDILSSVVDPPCFHGINYQYDLFREISGGSSPTAMDIFVNPTTNVMGVSDSTTTWQGPTLTAYDHVQATTDVMLMGTINGGVGRGPCSRYDLLLTSTGNAYGQSYSRICGWADHNGSTQGDLSFQTNDGTGIANYATPLLLNSIAAAFTVPITSSVANGTAPFTVTSTTVVPNLNASEVGGVALSGLCQTSGTGCPAATTSGFSGTYTTTTGVGTCTFTYLNGLLKTKTGSC